MKPLLLTIILSTLLLFIATNNVQAQNQGVGIGAQVTSPAGLSLKTWVDDNSALSSALSFSISENTSSFYLHLDYLRHKAYDQPGWDVGELSYYYCGGSRFIWQEA
jgi:hypothetical protein